MCTKLLLLLKEGLHLSSESQKPGLLFRSFKYIRGTYIVAMKVAQIVTRYK